MKITTKSLEFWNDMFPSIEHDVNVLIKLWLKENGMSEHSYIFYGIKMGDGFPIKVTHNVSCSCHPEVRTAFQISLRVISVGVLAVMIGEVRNRSFSIVGNA